MKNNKFKEITNKKGFMIAIYSCAAIVIAMTGIIASNKEGDKQTRIEETKQAQAEEVNQSDVKSYRENQVTGNSALNASDGYAEKSEKSSEKSSESKVSKNKEEDNKKILNIIELAIKIEELLYDEIKSSFFSRYSRVRYDKYYQLNIMGNEMENIIYGN